MTEEMKTEELLNSYIDGELSVRQRTEVKRMISNDPKLAVRLSELRKCKTLVSALPVVQAPSIIMENIKASLEKKQIREKTVRLSDYREVKTRRKIFAAAAMFSLTALLVVVINMLMPTQLGNKENINQFAADIRLSGRLELKANDLPAVQSLITNAIENSGLHDYKNPLRDANRRIYTLYCGREGLNKILTDLEGDWDKISSAKLFLDTENFNESVEIASVTPSQISEIMNQKGMDRSIQVARDISVINNLNEILKERGIPAFGSHVNSGELKVPKPIIVKYYPSAQRDNEEKTIQLRIILSR